MNISVKNYRQLLNQVSGDHVKKIKTLLENHMDNWYLIDADLMIDLLDDTHITAADLTEALKGIAEFDAENTSFKNAVLAIELMLREEQRQKASCQAADEDFFGDEDSNESATVLSFYRGYGSFDDMRLAS